MSWPGLGAVGPGALVDARLQLHHAVQVVSSLGATLLPPRPDDSHPNLGWDRGRRAWVGRPVPAAPGLRAALEPAGFRLLLLAADGATRAELPLDGRTRSEALAWLGSALGSAGIRVPADGLALPGYELPPHPTGAGARFALPAPRVLEEIARWLDAAGLKLEARARDDADASQVRCWPHHFDLATLVTLERDAAGEPTRTLGLGLSPGDEHYAEPYWYASPWPAPAPAGRRLATLAAGGHWHTEGFLAAVLPGSELAGVPPAEQPARVDAWLAEAEAAVRQLARG